MRRFLVHLARFSALPAALFLVCELVLAASGESWPLDRVIAFQQSHPASTFLRALDQVFYAFKYRGIARRRPSVLVLGSSRTMKFRGGMFGAAAGSFFNAGGMINSLADLQAFCFSRPPGRVPDTLILGVDLWWLNDRVPPPFRFDDEIDRDRAWTFDQQIIGLRWLLVHPSTLGSEVIALATGRQREAVGLGARDGRGGFRPDGSFALAIAGPRPGEAWTFVDREDPPIIDRVRTGTANFIPTDRVSATRLAALGSILDEYRRGRRLVIGYLPPFSSAVAHELAMDPRQAAFFAEFRKAMPAIFADHGFPVIDASDIGALGMTDRFMSDGFHGEETIHARVVQLMLRDPRVRDAFPDADAALARALASPRTDDWHLDLPPH